MSFSYLTKNEQFFLLNMPDDTSMISQINKKWTTKNHYSYTHLTAKKLIFKGLLLRHYDQIRHKNGKIVVHKFISLTPLGKQAREVAKRLNETKH